MRLETADVDSAELRSFHIIGQRDNAPSIHDDTQKQYVRSPEEQHTSLNYYQTVYAVLNAEIHRLSMPNRQCCFIANGQ